MVRLVLVRHGAVASNERFGLVGRTDERLTEEGARQASALAAALGGIGLARVLSSPLARCLSTARRIAEAARVDVTVDDRLIEQDYGAWEGRTPGEILDPGAEDGGLAARWWSDPTVAPPGGESLASVAERVEQLAGEIAADGPAGPVVLVSHVGPIKCLVARVAGLALGTGVRRFFLDPGTYSVIDWGERGVLRVFNARGEWPLTRRRDRPGKAPEGVP